MPEDPQTTTNEQPVETETDEQPVENDDELPEATVEEAERLTRLARQAVVDEEAAAYRADRDDLLDEHGFAARVREDDDGETLVCYPQEWLDEEGTVRVERIEDTGRAAEVSLSGTADPEEWDDVEQHNRELVEAVREAHGPVHAENARIFADFMGNHYARPMESATAEELREFREEYVVRNAWLSEEQTESLEQSLRYVFDAAEKAFPEGG